MHCTIYQLSTAPPSLLYQMIIIGVEKNILKEFTSWLLYNIHISYINPFVHIIHYTCVQCISVCMWHVLLIPPNPTVLFFHTLWIHRVTWPLTWGWLVKIQRVIFLTKSPTTGITSFVKHLYNDSPYLRCSYVRGIPKKIHSL